MFIKYTYDTTMSTITTVRATNIHDCVTSSQLEPKVIELSGVNSSGSYECLYYSAINKVWFAMYVTGSAYAAGSRHVVATVPEFYRPARRTALAIDGLQDYSGVLKASINGDGEIGFTTSVAKASGDDMYISGWWHVPGL